MIFLLLAAAGFLVWYLVKHQAEKPVWPWVGLAVVAIAAVCSRGWGFGMMGGGMMGRGMMGRGFGGRGFGGRGMMGPGQGGQGMMNPNHMGNGMMSHLTGPWAWVMLGVRALVAIAVVVVAVVLIRKAIKAYNEKNSPLGVLQARLARGEITADEFDTLKSKLQG